jgi:uncharacterized membrane protein
MSTLSIVHVLVGLAAVIIGSVVLARSKGDARHKLLGWVYVGCLMTSLTAIIIRGLAHPVPFHGYAAAILGGIIVAILMSRRRDRVASWRAWHASLMSLSMLGAFVAIGGVVGGVALGVGKGPAYYRMFNAVIVCFTAVGLWVINRRPVIWGRLVERREARARMWFNVFAVAITALLVFTQWALFSG